MRMQLAWRWVCAAVIGGGLAVSSAQAGEEIFVLSELGPAGPVLLSFDSDLPLLPKSLKLISGLRSSERLVGLDYRPADGNLYAIGTTLATNPGPVPLPLPPPPPSAVRNLKTFYRIDRTSGSAVVVGTGITPPLGDDFGTQFGIDFNPTIDRVRIVSNLDRNVVINPDTGDISAVGVNLFYGPGDANEGANPNVSSIAYDNNVAGAVTTQQRAIDANLDILATLANNAGTLGTIGPLGLNVAPGGGFDVSGATNIGYAVLQREKIGTFTFPQQLFRINLETGAATANGAIFGIVLFGALPVTDLAVVPPPAAP